ncbi:MAG: recombinase family protein [Bacilli bacterium]
MAIWGYARISTDEVRQHIDRQFRELEKMGVPSENIYYDVASGAKTDRLEFNRLLQSVSRGDTIISTEVSRITRSIKHLIEIIDFVRENKLKLILGNFIVDCTSATPDCMTLATIQLMGVFSELERNILSERVRSGMANAKAKGSQIGRKIVDSVSDIPADFIKYYSLYKQGTINKSMLADLAKVSYPTTLKYIKIIEGN